MHLSLIFSHPFSSFPLPKVGPICFGDLSPACRRRISTPFPCQYFAISLCRSIYHWAVGYELVWGVLLIWMTQDWGSPLCPELWFIQPVGSMKDGACSFRRLPWGGENVHVKGFFFYNSICGNLDDWFCTWACWVICSWWNMLTNLAKETVNVHYVWKLIVNQL